MARLADRITQLERRSKCARSLEDLSNREINEMLLASVDAWLAEPDDANAPDPERQGVVAILREPLRCDGVKVNGRDGHDDRAVLRQWRTWLLDQRRSEA